MEFSEVAIVLPCQPSKREIALKDHSPTSIVFLLRLATLMVIFLFKKGQKTILLLNLWPDQQSKEPSKQYWNFLRTYSNNSLYLTFQVIKLPEKVASFVWHAVQGRMSSPLILRFYKASKGKAGKFSFSLPLE